MRISDWSSDVCSSDLPAGRSGGPRAHFGILRDGAEGAAARRLCNFRRIYPFGQRSGARGIHSARRNADRGAGHGADRAALEVAMTDTAHQRFTVNSTARSEEHTSALQSLMRISYAVFCLKKKKQTYTHNTHQ